MISYLFNKIEKFFKEEYMIVFISQEEYWRATVVLPIFRTMDADTLDYIEDELRERHDGEALIISITKL